jgi:hypothetical protein
VLQLPNVTGPEIVEQAGERARGQPTTGRRSRAPPSGPEITRERRELSSGRSRRGGTCRSITRATGNTGRADTGAARRPRGDPGSWPR